MTTLFLWILFSTHFFCSTISLDTFGGGLHGVIDMDEERAKVQARRQSKAKNTAEMMNMFLKEKQKGGGGAGSQGESFYEPYHHEGHWVFFRPPTTTTVTRKGEYIRPTTPKKYDPKKKTKPPTLATYRHCNIACLDIYKDYGKVCGRQFKIIYKTIYWKYMYRTFDNVCALDNYNCHDENKTYQLIYKGPCRQKENEINYNEPVTNPQGGYDVADETQRILEPFNIKPFMTHHYYKVAFPWRTLQIDYD